ncbi:hypothetical protein HYW55_04155 [Candidatus Gottesmanbacteria bacterium]|nr:hypothetical protein [Candidatus Gottesmanbacteria bacterium]
MWKKIYSENKAIVWAGVAAIVGIVAVLVKVPDEVTRFTLIMPIFAGFILFSILMTADEELEEETEGQISKTKSSKKSSKK